MRYHPLTTLEKLNYKIHKESKEWDFKNINVISFPSMGSKKSFSKRLKFCKKCYKKCKVSNQPGKVCFASLVMDENYTMKCQWRIWECYWRAVLGFMSEEKVPDCELEQRVQLTPEILVSYSWEKLGPREAKKLH